MLTPRSWVIKTLVSLLLMLGLIGLSPLAQTFTLQPQSHMIPSTGNLSQATAPPQGGTAVAENLTFYHVPPGSLPALALPAATAILPSPSFTSQLSPSPTASPTYPVTPTSIPTATTTPAVLPIFTASPILPPQNVVLAEHRVPTFPVWHQLLGLDCESAAATQWAGYYGFKINELDFQYSLPRSDNPDYGFVGDVNGPWGEVPPEGYGVYAGPVAIRLLTYGIPAVAVKGYTLDQLEAKIAGDNPVIVWVTGNVAPGKAYKYLDAEGRTTVVAAYEHVVIVTGYTPDSIRYISEGVYYTITTQAFLKSWAVLGNMAVVTP